MKIKYKGGNTAIQFSINNKVLKLYKDAEIDVTDTQVTELNNRPFFKKLIDKGVVELVGVSKPEPEPEAEKKLDDYNKDELLSMAKDLGLNLSSRTSKHNIITAIQEAQ